MYCLLQWTADLKEKERSKNTDQELLLSQSCRLLLWLKATRCMNTLSTIASVFHHFGQNEVSHQGLHTSPAPTPSLPSSLDRAPWAGRERSAVRYGQDKALWVLWLHFQAVEIFLFCRNRAEELGLEELDWVGTSSHSAQHWGKVTVLSGRGTDPQPGKIQRG